MADMPVTPGTAPRLVLNPYMAQLQAQFGSFDPNKVQTRRREYYSFVAYPRAGQSTFTFYGQTIGTTNRQLTNVQRSGHLDNPLIVRAVKTRFFLGVQNQNFWQGFDSNTITSDILNGFFQVGVLRVIIGSKEWMQLPSPFLYAPPGVGLPKVITAGQAATNVSRGPSVFLGYERVSAYVVDPSFLLGSDQQFQITIEYPAGPVPIIATDIVTADSGATALFIGVALDGIEVRPVQ